MKKTWSVKVFCSKLPQIITTIQLQELPGSAAGDRCFDRCRLWLLPRQKCDKESVGQTGGQTKRQKERKRETDRETERQTDRQTDRRTDRRTDRITDTTSYYVTVICSCNVALQVISLLFDEWRICLAVRLWTPSDQLVPRFRLFHSHRCYLTSAVKMSPLSTSVTLLQTARQSISAWFQHLKGTVNGITVSMVPHSVLACRSFYFKTWIALKAILTFYK